MRRFSTRRRVRSGIRLAAWPPSSAAGAYIASSTVSLSRRSSWIMPGVDQLQLAEAAAVVDRDLVGAKPDEIQQAVLQVVEELVVAHAAPPALAVHAR